MRHRVVFMGTPDFAIPSLDMLAALEGLEIVTVVSQPDRPAGRGQRVRRSAVSTRAESLGLPLWTPETLRDPDAVARLAALEPDVIVVVAYGEILRRNVLDIPAHGIINVHASLLPRHRGASPVAGALMAGDDETGVTIMRMDEGMDTGPILARRTLAIRPDHDRGTLRDELARLGAELLAETVPGYLSGAITPEPQDDSGATKTRLLRKQDGELDWSRPAQTLVNQIRGLNPFPGTYTFHGGERLKILAATPRPADDALPAPGTVVKRGDEILVATGEGYLRPDRLQPAGKRAMTIETFANGHPSFVGARLGGDDG